MRPKKTPMRMCLGCNEMKPKKELVRVVKAPQKEEAAPPEVSLDLTGKKPGRGAYLCRDAQCLRLARKSRRLERAFSCKIPEEVYQRLEEEIAQAERAAQEGQQPAGLLDEKGQPIIVIEEPEEPLPRRKGGGHG